MQMSKDTIKIRDKLNETDVPEELKSVLRTIFDLGYQYETETLDVVKASLEIVMSTMISESDKPELIISIIDLGSKCGIIDKNR